MIRPLTDRVTWTDEEPTEDSRQEIDSRTHPNGSVHVFSLGRVPRTAFLLPRAKLLSRHCQCQWDVGGHWYHDVATGRQELSVPKLLHKLEDLFSFPKTEA